MRATEHGREAVLLAQQRGEVSEHHQEATTLPAVVAAPTFVSGPKGGQVRLRRSRGVTGAVGRTVVRGRTTVNIPRPTGEPGVPIADRLPYWLRGPLVRHRFFVLAVWDSLSWIAALALSTWVRYEFDIDKVDFAELLLSVPIVVGVHLLAGFWQGLYKGRWHLGQLRGDGRAAALRRRGCDRPVHREHPGPLGPDQRAAHRRPSSSLVGDGGRSATPGASPSSSGKRPQADAEGCAGRWCSAPAREPSQLITATLRDPVSPYRARGDPRRRPAASSTSSIRGIPVRGTRDDIAAVAEETKADLLLIAIPSADSGLIREISELAAEADLEVAVLPPVGELFGTGIGLADIRPLTDADLLGRHTVDTDVEAIAGYLQGKVVLVTGAGGSIGSELCRQIMPLRPGRARAARPRRVGHPRLPAHPRRARPARHPEPGGGQHPGPRPHARGLRASGARRWCSTPPR